MSDLLTSSLFEPELFNLSDSDLVLFDAPNYDWSEPDTSNLGRFGLMENGSNDAIVEDVELFIDRNHDNIFMTDSLSNHSSGDVQQNYMMQTMMNNTMNTMNTMIAQQTPPQNPSKHHLNLPSLTNITPSNTSYNATMHPPDNMTLNGYPQLYHYANSQIPDHTESQQTDSSKTTTIYDPFSVGSYNDNYRHAQSEDVGYGG